MIVNYPNGGTQPVQPVGNAGGNRGRIIGNTFDPGNLNPEQDPYPSNGAGSEGEEPPTNQGQPTPDLPIPGPGRPKLINLFLNVEPSTTGTTARLYPKVRQSLVGSISSGSLRVQKIGVARCATQYDIITYPTRTTQTILNTFDTASEFTNVVIAINPIEDAIRSLSEGLITNGGIIVFTALIKDRLEGSIIVQDHPNEADYEAAAVLNARLISKQMYALLVPMGAGGFRFFTEQFAAFRDRVDIKVSENLGADVLNWIKQTANKADT